MNKLSSSDMPMLFIHGWAQSAKAWHYQQRHFKHARMLELPGHGQAKGSNNWLETLQQQLPCEPCIIIGWSLGGMLAMQLAQLPQSPIRKLVLVGSTPRFSVSSDWQHGSETHLLHQFQQALQQQDKNLLSRFFMLMLQYTDMPRCTVRECSRIAIDKQYPPQADMLAYGLQQLATLDLRMQLSRIKQATLLIHGTDDAVVPIAASQYLAKHIAHCTFTPIARAGHAAFLTHPDTFNQILEAWCHNN